MREAAVCDGEVGLASQLPPRSGFRSKTEGKGQRSQRSEGGSGAWGLPATMKPTPGCSDGPAGPLTCLAKGWPGAQWEAHTDPT